MAASSYLPNQRLVQKVLAPHAQWITESIFGAWLDWRGFPQGAAWRCSRSRANFVWEQIIDRALNALALASNVRSERVNETFNFLVDGVVLFKFKKANEKGISANFPTQTALSFHNHQNTAPGIPLVHHVEVIYQLNALEIDVQDILVVARNGPRVHWHYSLLQASTVTMPPVAVNPTPTPYARVVPRANQADKNQPKTT